MFPRPIGTSKPSEDVDDSNPDEMALGRRSSTPVSTDDLQSSQQTTPKEKRRFTFAGLLERKPTAASAAKERYAQYRDVGAGWVR